MWKFLDMNVPSGQSNMSDWCLSGDCCNSAVQTEWLKQQTRILMILEAKMSGIKMLASPESSEGLLPGLQPARPPTVSLRGRKGRGSLCGFFCKRTDPIPAGSGLRPDRPPEVPSPDATARGCHRVGTCRALASPLLVCSQGWPSGSGTRPRAHLPRPGRSVLRSRFLSS